MQRAWFVMAWIVAALATAGAQEATLRITLDDALVRGLDNSHRLAEMQARTEAAEAVEALRHADGRPSASVRGAYSRTNHVEEFSLTQPGGPPRVLYPDIPDNIRSRVELQWPIYNGGRTDALERAARAEHSATVADLAAARAD